MVVNDKCFFAQPRIWLWLPLLVFSSTVANSNISASLESHVHGNPSLEQRATYEPEIIQIIELVQQGQLEQALSLTQSHLRNFPKSRIAHLLHADILLGMTTQLPDIGAAALKADSATNVNTERLGLDGLKHQIKNRWSHAAIDAQDSHTKLPASLIHIGDHPYVIVTDMLKGRLYLYRNNQGVPELVRDYYLSVGSSGIGKQLEGDNKTPIGVYVINRYIKGEELPDLYGKGAFPVNYPNIVDRYRKRTGYGIWLHGTPSNTYARSPWASEGCFVLSNDDFLEIDQYIDAEDRIPVILSDQINWVSQSELADLKQDYMSVLKAWKSDWESLDTNAYLQHYSSNEFNFGRDNFRQWVNRKKQVNQAKTFIQVDLDLDSLFLYPGEKDMFVVKYRQRYLSNNYQGQATKEQYWRRNNDGQWQIVYEG